VIRSIGELLIRQTRETDIVGRIGGDEFAVVLTHIGGEAAQVKAEALAAALCTERVLHEGEAHYVSAAFGVAHMNANDTAERALARADEAMYADKALHRRAAAQG
jgi:diguanylate cyclase (GGDEF)-like protein